MSAERRGRYSDSVINIGMLEYVAMSPASASSRMGDDWKDTSIRVQPTLYHPSHLRGLLHGTTFYILIDLSIQYEPRNGDHPPWSKSHQHCIGLT